MRTRVMNDEMKGISAEYLRSVKLLAQSKLNAGNLIAGVNSCAIGVLGYSAVLIDWVMMT